MKPQPDPERFKRPELQEAYEMGFHQEFDHDSFALLDRFAWLYDGPRQLGTRRRA